MSTTVTLYNGAADVLFHAAQGPRLIVTPNVDHLRLLQLSSSFRRAYRAADVVVNDSRVLDLIAFAGHALKLSGSDLTPQRLASLPAGSRVTVVGCPPTVRAWLEQSYPHLVFQLIEPSMGFIGRASERRAIQAQVLSHDPDVVFVCTGAPQSEIFAAQLRRHLSRGDIICSGSSLIFMAGLKKRAPPVMQLLGGEWLWRMALEPHTRRRYLLDLAFLLSRLPALVAFRIRRSSELGKYRVVSA